LFDKIEPALQSINPATDSIYIAVSPFVTVHALEFRLCERFFRRNSLDKSSGMVYRMVDECENRSGRRQQADGGEWTFASACAKPGRTATENRESAAGDRETP